MQHRWLGTLPLTFFFWIPLTPLHFQAPLFVGDEARAKAQVLRFHESKPVVILSTQCFDSKDNLLMDGTAAVMIPQELYEASKNLKEE